MTKIFFVVSLALLSVVVIVKSKIIFKK